MGEVERKVKKDVRKSRVNTAIICTLAITGGLAVTALAPNIFQVLKWTGYVNQRKQTLHKSLQRLIKRGYVVRRGGALYLTAKGEQLASHIGDGRIVPAKTKRWDGKWRILVFDIPENRRRTRDQIRFTLQQIGFHRLQDSVWVYPYDCEDLIQLIKTDLRARKEVVYIVADHIENDKNIRALFNLKQSLK